TRPWLASLSAPYRVILNEKNLGYARSNNIVAAAAKADVLVLLNNDLVLKPGWFEPMYRALRRDPRLALVGNVQVTVAGLDVDPAGIRFNHFAKIEHLRDVPK